MFDLQLDWPWLALSFDRPHRVLSWAVHRPGFVEASEILWREVRNEDLSRDVDVTDWLAGQIAEKGCEAAVVMLTSRNIRTFQTRSAEVEGVKAAAVVTVGLSNVERVGARLTPDQRLEEWGTINIAVITDQGLTDIALLEASSIITEARTTAVIEAGIRLPTGIATGTGTDCIAVAAPAGEGTYCGLHTPLGEAIGRAVYDAVRACTEDWLTNRPC